jgi:hypothetical protein
MHTGEDDEKVDFRLELRISILLKVTMAIQLTSLRMSTSKQHCPHFVFTNRMEALWGITIILSSF